MCCLGMAHFYSQFYQNHKRVHAHRLHVCGREIPWQFAMPARIWLCATCAEPGCGHAHLLRCSCAGDKSGSNSVHADEHALIHSASHTHTLTLFWPFAQSQRGSSFVPQLNSGRNEMVIQRKPHCVWQSPSSQQPQSGGYNMAAGMLIRPWVKALHSGSLPHTEHVTSVFDTTFCRREYTATGQSNTQLLQTLSTHTGKHSGKGWAHGVKNTFSFHNLAKEPS